MVHNMLLSFRLISAVDQEPRTLYFLLFLRLPRNVKSNAGMCGCAHCNVVYYMYLLVIVMVIHVKWFGRLW